MSRLIAPIPMGVQIVDAAGTITTFFRLKWQALIDGAILTSNVADSQALTQTAAIPTANAYVTRSGAVYRVTYYLRKTIADGVSSLLQMTIGWTDHGTSIVQTFPPLTTDTTAATQSGTLLVYCDGASSITYDIAYASNTPAKMTYNAYVFVEQMAQ